MTPFSLLDIVDKLLKDHRESLGAAYEPLRALFGALVFVVIVAAILALPLIAFDTFRNIVICQVVLLVVYFMLLLARELRELDRFVFCLCLIIVFAATPVALLAADQYRVTVADNPAFAERGIAFPKIDIFFYGFARGFGNVAWSLPLLFGFYIFAPRWKRGRKGAGSVADRLLGRLRIAVLVGLGLQLVAIVTIGWQDDVLGRWRAPTTGADEHLVPLIDRLQQQYLASSAAYLAAGFLALSAVWIWGRRRGDARVLAIVAGALLATQIAYCFASLSARRLNQLYPAARHTRILTFKDRQSGEIVFTRRLFADIGAPELADWQDYYACEQPGAHRFSYRVAPRSDFYGSGGQFEEVLIEQQRPSALFCQEVR